MSYNTRRTPTGRGGSPATQVTYHQQPASRQTSNTQSRNPGYSTQQQAYQTTSPTQGYSTGQSGYNTSATPPTPAAQPKMTQQPPLPSTPAPPSQPQAAPPVKTPIVKQELPPTPQNTPGTGEEEMSTENGEKTPGTKPPFWVYLKNKKPAVKVSNKIKRARQNAKLRRILNPKNALTFLNELKPGAVKFSVREEAGWGYVASVDIEGKTFTGHALNVSKAKVLASEHALKHLLMEKLTKSQETPPEDVKEGENKDEDEPMDESADGEEPKAKRAKTEEDEMPWGSLAAFALHKLFADWQNQGPEDMSATDDKYDEAEAGGEEGYFPRRSGPPPDFGYPPRRMPPPGVFARGRGYAPYPPRGPPPPHFAGPGPRRSLPPAVFGAPRPQFPLPGAAPLPMKKIPDDATKRHPVMLLNQLKPNLVYQESKEGELPNIFFKISVNIEGKEYIGRGKSKKEAKKNAAKSALAPLGIVYEGEQF